MAELRHCHHLWFSAIPILLVKPDPAPQFRSLCQIWRESVHKWQNYHRITDFKMAASTILDFCICKFWWQIDAGALYSAYLSNWEQICAIMAELWPKKWFSIWRPPPSWILSDMSSEGKSCPRTLFYMSVSNLVQIRSKMVELLPFNWLQNGGRRHLGFMHYVNFDSKSVCGTPFSTYVSNSVQIRAIMAKLWPKM